MNWKTARLNFIVALPFAIALWWIRRWWLPGVLLIVSLVFMDAVNKYEPRAWWRHVLSAVLFFALFLYLTGRH